jgi:UDP-N-acetylglucosamine diphosphorylase/glucosamine-1-phosphate N-acetyltransferase
LPHLSIPASINTPLDDQPALLSSGRILYLSQFDAPKEPCVVVDEGNLIRTAYVHSPGLSPEDCLLRSPAWMEILDLPKAESQGRLPEYIWDLVHWNEEAIVADAIQWGDKRKTLKAGPYHVIDEESVYVEPHAKIAPGVVIDATKGPVMIDEGATIGANSVLEGPCYIGKHVTLTALSLIHGGTSIGPMCKIGGETANAIFLGYSNQAHAGFVGHSYIGEWVNLGADTTTSNLKVTYGPIKMRIGGREIVTDRRFLGSMIGDHTKTAIGTRLMSGSYIGFCSLLAASKLPPQFIPSFSFWTDKGMEPYRREKAREVMGQVYSRRGRNWSDEDEKIVDYVAATAAGIEK